MIERTNAQSVVGVQKTKHGGNIAILIYYKTGKVLKS